MQPLKERDPRQVGPYEIVGRLGSGAMGQVLLARGPGGRMAAIKLVHDNLASDDSFRERFRREVSAARRVSGPRTAAVLDADPEADVPWMAVEYVEGPNLQQHVRAHGPLAAAHVFWLAQGIALALGEIHQAGVIHRDLKPTNVLLSPTGPRVIDFGIARSSDASALTTTGLVTGSPAYMSPEQATSGSVTGASDIFCLGAVLFFAATGHAVHGDGPPAAMLYRVVNHDPDLSVISDAELRVLIDACLRKDPAARPGLASISDYASRQAGARDPRMLTGASRGAGVGARASAVAAPASPTHMMGQPAPTQPLPPVRTGPEWNQPYGPPANEFLDSPTRIGEPPPGGRGGSGAPDGPGRRSATGPALLATLVVLLLIGGGFFAVTLLREQANDRGRPSVSASGQPRPAATTTQPATSPATDPADPATSPPVTAPATTAGAARPQYLYEHATGVLTALSGNRRSYAQDGFQSATSTAFRVGCTPGSAWATAFDVAPGARRLTGTILLDPQITPPDLEVAVTLLADGKQIESWQLETGDQHKVNENLRGAATIEIRAVATAGTCGNAAIGYGVLVDGAFT